MTRTLHEVMSILLSEVNGIPAKKLASNISTLSLYKKRNNSKLEPNQIYARVYQYPELFYIEDGKVYKR